MHKVTERQQLTENKPVIILMVAMLSPILIMIGVTMAEAENFDNENSLAIGATALILLLTFFFIFRMSTVVELSPKGLRYKNMPISRSLKLLPLKEIRSVTIETHKWWRGYGYRKSFSGTRTFAMKPGKILKVETRSGKYLLFGINRPSVVLRVINNEWPNIKVHV